MELRIDKIDGIDDFLRRIGELSVQKVINGSIKKSLIRLSDVAQTEAPWKTGQMRRAWEYKFRNLEGELIHKTLYGLYVHEGTGIYARGGNGRKTPWVYKDAKNIFHWTRWQKANPFLERAFLKTEPKLEQIFRDDIANFLTDLTK